ncbi:MAG: acetate/propionate family kinase [Campylobacterota bacterium]|nr:acetate/propionate family kinase [Campylobacterota bacterium]
MILTFNVGSSSIKVKLFSDTLQERQSFLKEQISSNHEEAFQEIFENLDMEKIEIVAHRVVHGGEFYHEATTINDEVKSNIESLIELAPLHNGANLLGISIAQKFFPNALHVAIFDTAFHNSIKSHAYLYALPYEMYENDKIRRYGFHGSSHQYVSKRAAELLHVKSGNFITCHLGNGASICAIKEMKSVDTSMGFTPLEGLMMGTRCGDIDPSIVFFLQKKYPDMDVENILNKKSGLLGVASNSDMRDLISEAYSGNELSAKAIEMFCYKIAKYIGAYFIALGRVDAIIFTGGIGENSALIREKVCAVIGEALHVELNDEMNSKNSTLISKESSQIKIMSIKTDEELEMATQALKKG